MSPSREVPPCASFYFGKSKCKMIPFNRGSHLNALGRGEEREQAGRCISCSYLNGNLNGSRTFPPYVGSCPELPFVPGCAVRPGHRRCCRSLGLLQSFCLACLSLFSVADIHAKGFHISASLVFQGCIVQSGNTMNARGTCSNILQRSVELHWYNWMDENDECALCRVHVLWDEDEIRSRHMMSLLICILYVLVGFHQLIPSLFHFPWLSLFLYPLLPFSTICAS